MGEKYAPASNEDTKLWFACLAAVPPEMGIAYLWAKVASDWPIFLIWLGATCEGLIFLILWFLISRLPGIKSIGAIAIIGWVAAFLIAYRINQ